MKRIAILTTVHIRTDTRIFIKEATCLAKRLDANVTLFVQDGLKDQEYRDRDVTVIDTGVRPKGRIERMVFGSARMFRLVKKSKPDVVHFHDPELIPIGILFKLFGVKVVYDVHEDVPRQVLAKHYIPAALRYPISLLVGLAEKCAGWMFDGIVVATSTIGKRFPSKKVVLVQNFPIAKELIPKNPVVFSGRENVFAYVGSITKTRGILEMVEAIGLTSAHDMKILLAGSFDSIEIENAVKDLSGWQQVDYFGWADREKIVEMLSRARAGLVVLNPTLNYVDALPVKMFEYMAAGIPVIASDFPLWREIVDGAACGILVDPLDPKEIAKAMDWIVTHPEQAEAMGKSGQRAILERYNWDKEADKLLNFYSEKFDIAQKL